MTKPMRLFLLFSFGVFASTAIFASDDSSPPRLAPHHICNAILGDHSKIRYFRGGGKRYVQKPTGMYIETPYGLRYLPGRRTAKAEIESPLLKVTSTKNFGSHMEIIRRQIGEARFNAIMKSRNPDEALSRELQNGLASTTEQEEALDATTLRELIESEYNDKEPLSQQREDQVFAVLRDMGRLAEPMVEWLKPLILNNRLKQLPTSLMQDPIEKTAKAGTLVYKALRVTVLLNGEKTFYMSAGETGLPDSVHRVVLEAMRLIVPNGRIVGATSGYFVIRSYIPGIQGYGNIQFVTKGSEKQSLASESFDFREK